MIEPIETDRLRIRDVVPTDCEAFFGYMKLEEYWRDVPITVMREIGGTPDTNLMRPEDAVFKVAFVMVAKVEGY